MSTNREPGVVNYKRRLAMGYATLTALSAGAVLALLPNKSNHHPVTTTTETTTRLHTADPILNKTDEQLLQLRTKMESMIGEDRGPVVYSRPFSYEGNNYRRLIARIPDPVAPGKFNAAELILRRRDSSVADAILYEGLDSREFTPSNPHKTDRTTIIQRGIIGSQESMDLQAGPTLSDGEFAVDTDIGIDGQRPPGSVYAQKSSYYGQFILKFTDLLNSVEPILN